MLKVWGGVCENIKMHSGGLEKKPASFASPLEVGRLLCCFVFVSFRFVHGLVSMNLVCFVVVSFRFVRFVRLVLSSLFCFVSFRFAHGLVSILFSSLSLILVTVTR